MKKLIAASAALLIAMAPTFTLAQDATDEDDDELAAELPATDTILIGPEAADATAIAAGAAGLIGLGLLLGGGGGGSSTTTTTTTTTGN